MVVVASAGNSGQDLAFFPQYPAGYNAGNLITVAATDNRDQLAPAQTTARRRHVGALGSGYPDDATRWGIWDSQRDVGCGADRGRGGRPAQNAAFVGVGPEHPPESD